MQKELNLILTPEQASNENLYKPVAAEKLNIEPQRITFCKVIYSGLIENTSAHCIIRYNTNYQKIKFTHLI